LEGWNHIALHPRLIDTEKTFWWNNSERHIDQVITIVLSLCKELKCIVCGNKESLNFKSFASLTIHLRYHRARTIQWWLDNIITKSPKELNEMTGGFTV